MAPPSISDLTGLENIDLESPFDPAEYDNQMSHLFNEEYYSGQDMNPDHEDRDTGENIKPVWNEDSEFFWEDSSLAIPEQESMRMAENKSSNRNLNEYDESQDNRDLHEEGEEEIMDADYLPGGDKYQPGLSVKNLLPTKPVKKLSKREQKKLERKLKEKITNFDDYLEEYHGLDYEDMVRDLSHPLTLSPSTSFSLSFPLTFFVLIPSPSPNLLKPLL